jgi:hypothetical protein
MPEPYARCARPDLDQCSLSAFSLCFFATLSLRALSIFLAGESLTSNLHPAAHDPLPWFISGPTDGDALYVITTVAVIAAIVGIGVLFFTLHSLPERLGHKKLQFEVVAVLGLLSLFTHIHAFWVAGLLLALVDLPDFVSPLKRIAGALEKHVGIEPPLESVPVAEQLSAASRAAVQNPPTSDDRDGSMSAGEGRGA